MKKTTIDVDDELLERAMRLYGTRTPSETVELALRRLIGGTLSREQALAMEGTGWRDELHERGHDDESDSRPARVVHRVTVTTAGDSLPLVTIEDLPPVSNEDAVDAIHRQRDGDRSTRQ